MSLSDKRNKILTGKFPTRWGYRYLEEDVKLFINNIKKRLDDMSGVIHPEERNKIIDEEAGDKLVGGGE